MMASEIGCGAPDRGEEDREHAIHHDDEEDALHDRSRGVRAERLGAALHGKALDTGDDADHRGHDRRLDDADDEMIDRDRVAQAQQEGFGIDAAIEPGHQPAAIERGHGTEEGEDRHRNDEREQPRQDQHLDRVEAHGPERIDLLAHLH